MSSQKDNSTETVLSLSELSLRLGMWSDEWEEKKKGKDEDYIIPESGVVGLRFPKEYAGRKIKIYTRKQ